MNRERERSVTAAFVTIANSLVEDYDIADLYSALTSDCARLLDVESVGMLLAGRDGILRVAAASSEQLRLTKLNQVQRREGPCLDCYSSGAPVLAPDLSREHARWPDFVALATAAGYASVHAVPMRLRDTVLGSLGLFGTSPGVLNEGDLRLAQALAHVASIALVVNKAATDRAAVNEQLQTALNSRVVLEQAKGLLGQVGDLDMDHAFEILRRYARDRNLRLSDVAAAVVSRELAAQLVLDHVRAQLRRGSKT